MNNVSLLGRLTRDPELKYTQSGTAVVRFNVAVDRRMSKEKRQEAEAAKQPTADFINCTAWRQTAELIANYFKKGNRIGVTGRIQTGSYEKDGTKVYTTDVVVESIDFVESKNESAGNGNNQGNNQENYNIENDDNFFPIDNDDIPF